MCNLKDEPWKASFTGPRCRCGVPTPGNDVERQLQKDLEAKAKQDRLIEHKAQLEAYRTKRIAEMLNKNRGK